MISAEKGNGKRIKRLMLKNYNHKSCLNCQNNALKEKDYTHNI